MNTAVRGYVPRCSWMPDQVRHDGSGALAFEHRVELPSPLQLGEVVGAADVAAVAEDLGGGVLAARALEHLVALAGERVDLILFIVRALLAEQRLGAGAIGAAELGIDFHARHSSRSCFHRLCGAMPVNAPRGQAFRRRDRYFRPAPRRYAFEFSCRQSSASPCRR